MSKTTIRMPFAKRQTNGAFSRRNGAIGLESSNNGRKIEAAANVALKVSQNLRQKIRKVNPKLTLSPMQQLESIVAPAEFCPFQNVQGCDPNGRFRSVDGSCNNLQNPWWGKSEIPYTRILPPAYDDGIIMPRAKSTTGLPLPNPREISLGLCTEVPDVEQFYTHILPIFGQFLAHDITSVSVSTEANGGIVDCPCGSTNPSCLSIVMPSNDNLLRMSCMKFTRSSAAFSSFDCRLGVREQLNLLSAFLDGSQIYGINQERANELRSFQGGLLAATGNARGRPFVKQGTDTSCRDTSVRTQCFFAGEGRTNENLALTSMHTLFNRNHNKIATTLASLNPQWIDETIYQEARKINLAIYEHIIYNEFVPTIIGWNTATAFDLLPQSEDAFFMGYDRNVNPTLANEFSAAGFRFGHTLIRNILSRSQNNRMGSPVQLSDIIFRPVEAYNAAEGGIDGILEGLLKDQTSKYDTHFAHTLQNRLFEFKLSDGSVIAVDLAATNINRGRDHGINPYNLYREQCGLPRAKSFEELSDTITPEQIQRLQRIYAHVDDIDLYIGGLSETPVTGAVVGPTFGCIIGKQFSALKKGDRFFYENGSGSQAFTLPQLAEVKKITFSKLICDNTDIQVIQPNVFLQAIEEIKNSQVPCESLTGMNLQAWISQI